MLRSDLDRAPLAKCAACGQAAENGFWTAWLCSTCNAAWLAEAPTVDELERAHAAAHPEDVDAGGAYGQRDAARHAEAWVLLKPGVSARVCRDAARAWLLRRKASMAVRAA